MSYILAKFKIKTEQPRNYKLSSASQKIKITIQKEDIIEGAKFLDQAGLSICNRSSDSFLAIFELDPLNEKCKQDKQLLHNILKTNIQTGNHKQDNREYYILLYTHKSFYYPVIKWVGTDLNKKAFDNMIYNVQAITLGFVNNFSIRHYISEDPTRELDFSDLLDNIIQYV